MSNVYSYVRDSQSRQWLPVELQKQQIEEYRLRKVPNDTWVDHFVDSSDWAETPFLERPAGRKLNEMLSGGDHIIITRLVCAFASDIDAIMTMGHWAAMGVYFHCLELPLVIFGDLAAKIRIAYAKVTECFRELKKELIRNRIWRRKMQGFHANGPVPLGFKSVGPKDKRKLVSDDKERKICKLIRDLHQGTGTPNGQPLTAERIYFHLLKNRVMTKYGRPWGIKRIKSAIVLAEALKGNEQEGCMAS
jgi:DNA invertase Pin-like site-specific DNA recombinase